MVKDNDITDNDITECLNTEPINLIELIKTNTVDISLKSSVGYQESINFKQKTRLCSLYV